VLAGLVALAYQVLPKNRLRAGRSVRPAALGVRHPAIGLIRTLNHAGHRRPASGSVRTIAIGPTAPLHSQTRRVVPQPVSRRRPRSRSAHLIRCRDNQVVGVVRQVREGCADAAGRSVELRFVAPRDASYLATGEFLLRDLAMRFAD